MHHFLDKYHPHIQQGFCWLLTGLCLYRICTLSMTHDESATWLFTQEQSVLDSLFRSEAWGTANNHFLNSILISLGTAIWGISEFATRWHLVALFLIYGYAGIAVVSRLSKNSGVRLLGLVLLVFNPYVFDFFCVARGYGGAMAMLMVAFYLLLRYEEKQHTLDLTKMYAALMIGSLFLFTHLLFVPIFTAAVWYIAWQKGIWKRSRLLLILLPAMAAVVIIMLVYIPIRELIHNEEFRWGTTSLCHSLKSILMDSLYDRQWLGNHTDDLLILFTATVIGSLVWLGFKEQKEPLKILLLLLILLIMSLISSHLISGALYPIDRKSLIYWPFLALMWAMSLGAISHKQIRNMVAIGLSTVLIIHFIFTLKNSQVHEWYYDAGTSDHVLAIVEDSQEKNIDLAVHWLYHWTTKFYIRKFDAFDRINLKPYSKELDLSHNYDYYLVPEEDEKHLHNNYTEILRRAQGSVLLKK